MVNELANVNTSCFFFYNIKYCVHCFFPHESPISRRLIQVHVVQFSKKKNYVAEQHQLLCTNIAVACDEMSSDEAEVVVFNLLSIRLLSLKKGMIGGSFQRLHLNFLLGLGRMFLLVPFTVTLVADKPKMKIPHHTEERHDQNQNNDHER